MKTMEKTEWQKVCNTLGITMEYLEAVWKKHKDQFVDKDGFPMQPNYFTLYASVMAERAENEQKNFEYELQPKRSRNLSEQVYHSKKYGSVVLTQVLHANDDPVCLMPYHRKRTEFRLFCTDKSVWIPNSALLEDGTIDRYAKIDGLLEAFEARILAAREIWLSN